MDQLSSDSTLFNYRYWLIARFFFKANFQTVKENYAMSTEVIKNLEALCNNLQE